MSANTETSASDLVKKIDFSKGFLSWHVKWPIKKVVEDQISTEFTIGDSKWRLHIGKDTDSIDVTTKLPRGSSDRMPLNIFRLAFQNPGHQPFFSQSGIRVINKKIFTNSPFIPPGYASRFKDECIVHFWLNIPNAMSENSAIDLPTPETSTILTTLLSSALGTNPISDSFTDVTLILVNQENEPLRRFFCHRNILGSRSDVFARMFSEGEWKEGVEGQVEIEDIDVETMEAILKYIYTCQVPEVKCPINAQILYAANKYNLPALMRWSEIDLIIYHSGDANRIDQLRLAEMYRLNDLKSICVASLCTNMALFNTEIRARLSDEVIDEVNEAAAMRQLETKVINVTTDQACRHA